MRFLFRAYIIPFAVISLLLLSSMTTWSSAVENPPDEAMTRSGERSADGDSWTMYKGDLGRTGYSPSPIPLKHGTKPLWQVLIPALKQTNAPVVLNNTVYVGSGDGNMRGYDIDTGELIWQVKASNKHLSTQATIDSDVIYFGADDGHVYGFDILTRTKVFDVNINTSAIFASPTIAEGMLFIGTLGRNLMNSSFYGVDISTQEISWYHDIGDALNIYGFSGTAAYDNGRVYIGDGKGIMYCFDPDGFLDGNDGPYTMEENDTAGYPDMIWQFNASSSIIGSPVIAEGRVYFGNDIGDFFALDLSDGSLAWKRRIGAGEPPSIQASASYLDGTLYVAAQRVYGPYDQSKGGSIHAVDPATGSQKWRFNVTGQMLKSSPVILDGALIFAAGSGNTSVFCISTEDEHIADEDRVLWYFNTRAPIWSPAAVADGRVFICRPDSSGGNGHLYVLGSPEPKVKEVSISDGSPFIGELVEVNALIENNATVDVSIDIQFKASSFDFQEQVLIGMLEGVVIEAFETRSLSVEWTVEPGYDMVVAFITDTTPADEDKSNNFGTIDIFYNRMLSDGWLSAGSGPGRTGSSGTRLDSNRTYWITSLDGAWKGSPEDVWYGGSSGNGTISAAGGHVYMTGPDGSLICMGANPGVGGSPEILWSYHNSSVDLLGRPLLLIESSMSLAGSNKVFVIGDDGALWAFDWAGFMDGNNDGPYLMEVDKGSSAGDVIWRTPIPASQAGAMFISGGNILVPLSNGDLAAFDDDTGDLLWTIPTGSHEPYAADLLSVFMFSGSILNVLDPHTGVVSAGYDLGAIMDGHEARSVSYWDGYLLVSFNDTVALLDAYPDDNGDGSVDLDDEDLGEEDNGTGFDLIWKAGMGEPVISPPTPSEQGGAVAVVTPSSMEFLLLENGTRSTAFPLPDVAASRAISAGDSFYLVTGSGPWTLRAYSPFVQGVYAPTWTHDIESMPRGEGAIMGDNLFLSTSDGMVEAIGADNNAPVAKITSPTDGILLFPEEMVELDASGSYDPEEDPMIYAWYLEDDQEPIYIGELPVVTLSLQGMGSSKLVLRVFDDMKAVGEDSINVTILKRITYPDHKDFLNDIYIHMSFGISEPSGAYIINSTVPEDQPAVPGAVFVASITFTPLPKYAQYRFEWANVSLGYFGREFPIGMHQEKLRLYHFDQSLSIWVQAPSSGVDLENSQVWGNFSDLSEGMYALGILDNSIPELRHIKDLQVFKPTGSSRYTFTAEFRDSDGDIPVSFRLVVDNQTEHRLEVDGVLGSTTRFTYFSAEDVQLTAQTHSYYFEVDDGFFIVRSPYYKVIVDNNPPQAVIIWQAGLVTVRETVQFSAEGTTDIDMDVLSYDWDFDHVGEVFDRDAVGKIVSHEFYSPGVYNVTLRVSDGKDEVYKTIIVTVIEEEGSPPSTLWWILALVTIMAILIVAVVAFLVLSKKGREEQDEVKKLASETWSCPECGKKISRAVEECPVCGYEYDPLDFDEEMDEM